MKQFSYPLFSLFFSSNFYLDKAVQKWKEETCFSVLSLCMHLKLQPASLLMEACTQFCACDSSEERVVCTYVAALGRAVVKGLSILYLVGYFLSPKGDILLLHRQ